MHLKGVCTYKQGYRNTDFTGKYSYNYVPFNCCMLNWHTPLLRCTLKILTFALTPTIGWSYILHWESSTTVWEIIKKQRKCWKKPGGCIRRKIWRRQKKVLGLLGNWDGFISKKPNSRIGFVMCCSKIKWRNFWVWTVDTSLSNTEPTRHTALKESRRTDLSGIVQ